MAECATAPGFNQSRCLDDQVQRGRNFILVLHGKVCPSAAGSAAGCLPMEETSSGCKQPETLSDTWGHTVMDEELEGIKVQGWYLPHLPPSCLPALVPKNLFQPRHAKDCVCMFPADVKWFYSPHDTLQLAQCLKGTSSESPLSCQDKATLPPSPTGAEGWWGGWTKVLSWRSQFAMLAAESRKLSQGWRCNNRCFTDYECHST